MSNRLMKFEPIDYSFLWFSHPNLVSQTSIFPEFADLKIFLDNLLIDFQLNKTFEYQLTQRSISCPPFRRDFLFESSPISVILVLILIDFVFLIPFFVLIVNLIRDKNEKISEILEILRISSIFNSIAQAVRTLVIVTILIFIFCLSLKFNLNSDAFFNRIHFRSLFLSYFVFNLQLISFGVFIGRISNRIFRSICGTFSFYLFSLIFSPKILIWPTEIQYILIFISPFIGGYSLFQQMILHEFALKDLTFFEPIYRHVPTFFPTLIVMFVSCVFYWFLFGGFIDLRFHRRRKIDAVSLRQTSSIVSVENLTKIFGPDRIAVDDVSFELYENQITSLLGPNGSGKTTIFNCLMGLCQPTSGRIVIENEVETDFQSIGFCPQHDILFDLFTVKEQIEFYATARGFGSRREQIVEEMLNFVDLQASKNFFCRSLSGGMKRRLSLACAFVGETKIVLLDEPSSGLDPSNRRALWNWLKTMKRGKTLLLTTHFLEESDALSDRILILFDGKIRADGTSTNLKEKFGSGYKIIVQKDLSMRSEEIRENLRRFLPEISIESETLSGDVVFRTNQRPNEKFLQSFKELDRMKENQQIQSFAVQNSTLDDVFHRITTREQRSIDSHRIERKCREIFQTTNFFIGFDFYLSQFYGLLMKTLRVRCRRWTLTFVAVCLPICFHLFSNFVVQRRHDIGIFPMNINSIDPQTIVYQSDRSIEKSFRSTIFSQRNGKIRLDRHSTNISQLNRYVFDRRSKHPFAFTEIFFAFSFPKFDENLYQIESLASNLVSAYEIVSVASNTFYKFLTNDTDASIETTLIYKNIGNISIQPTFSDLFKLFSTASCALKFLPASLILDVFVFYFFFFYTTIFLVAERKDRFVSLLNISGLHPMTYWIYNYFFDLIVSIVWFSYLLIVFCLIEILFNGFPQSSNFSILNIDFEFANQWNLRVQFYPLTILIVLPSLPFVYLLTKFFRNDILAGISIIFIFILIHTISIIVPIVNIIVRSSSTRHFLFWLFNILFPNINSQVLITYLLARQSRFCQLANLLFDATDFHPLGDDTIEWNIVILVVHIVFFLFVVILIDTGYFRCSLSCFYRSNFDEKLLDDDVRVERNRSFDENDHFIVEDLVKYYPWKNRLVVNHLTFAVRRGEAFGLLGFNGAGKTTTFRILVRDLIATRGQIKINDVRPFLGYCPQDNCSMEFLTVDDVLILMARIRGVRFSRLYSLISTISSLFLLEPFRHNYIHQLSGGTKRRLHAALALIGPPTVAILDEPTTGVDPNARLQMQEIFLNAVKMRLTLILTSHSMDECERVCDRLGILVRGQFACLGTIQHLKSKFGRGYTIDIKVRLDTSMENIRNFFLQQKQFDIETKEITNSTGLFQCQRVNPADLFQFLEENKTQLNIETYSISQTTLEQIFLSVGKQRDNEHFITISF